jgi:hypothetical protein
MPFSGMWSRVGLLQNDVSDERVASIFRVKKNGREKESYMVTIRLLQFGGTESTDITFYSEDGSDTFLRNVGL